MAAARILPLFFLLSIAVSLISTLTWAQVIGSDLPAQLNSTCVTIKTVVGSLFLIFLIISATLYSKSYFSSNKQAKDNLKKWSRNFLICAVIALPIYFFAPIISTVLAVNTGGQGVPVVYVC